MTLIDIMLCNSKVFEAELLNYGQILFWETFPARYIRIMCPVMTMKTSADVPKDKTNIRLFNA